MRGARRARHPLPPSMNRGPEYWRRRGLKAKHVRVCGSCKGRGGPDPHRRKRVSFYIYIFHPESTAGLSEWEGVITRRSLHDARYVEVPVYLNRLACGTCGGSGLNCSQQRALEIEQASA